MGSTMLMIIPYKGRYAVHPDYEYIIAVIKNNAIKFLFILNSVYTLSFNRPLITSVIL